MENNLESRPSYIICGTFFHFAPVQNKDVGSLFKKEKKKTGKNVQLKVLKYNEIYR